MFSFSGNHSGTWPPKSLVQHHNSSHCSALTLCADHSTNTRSPAANAKRYSSRWIYQSPESDRSSLVANEPSPSPPYISQQISVRRKRPRHVPILISQGLIDTVLRDLETSPLSAKSAPENRWIPQLFPPLSAKQHSDTPARSPVRQPRHIPIVIPSFAQPYGPFPPTPAASDSGRSSPATVILRKGGTRPPTPPMTGSRPATGLSQAGAADTSNTHASPDQPHGARTAASSGMYGSMSSSQTSLVSNDGLEEMGTGAANHIATGSMSQSHNGPASMMNSQSAPISNNASASMTQSIGGQFAPTTNLTGLVCNVHKCTGREPHALVGATTTILGDKLYVFGGKRLSRRKAPLTSDLYELDLIKRHWTKLETTGTVPAPRYFHSMCALGDTKLICYGGMSPAHNTEQQQTSPVPQHEQQAEVVVKSDIHIYDTGTRSWTYIHTTNDPQARYAHCATVVQSSAVFSSANAPVASLHHNPSSANGNPNQGSLGVVIDGSGGAEMIVVGGQDSASQYIEQISVFNLRSLRWTTTTTLGRSCGAYRSVVASLTGLHSSKIGMAGGGSADDARNSKSVAREHSTLIYSNYNFMDVKLELQVRAPDGSLSEKPMNTDFSPPGLRFPNGGVLDNYFIVSGTYLTSMTQQYALWALDLRTLTWSRIDVGRSVFSQGSWNRGILWPRRNTFVVLGSRKRNLADDYNHRRINFTNICLVELEAFGLYENARQTAPTSSYVSCSAPILPPSMTPKSALWSAGGRPHVSAADELGRMALGIREIADIDIVALNGQRIPANSHILARRWGPYFVQLLKEGTSKNNDGLTTASASMASDQSTLRQPAGSRNSSITITPSIGTGFSATTVTSNSTSQADSASTRTTETSNPFHPPTTTSLLPSRRSRALFLPHTALTIQALLHYLYTSSLPAPPHQLSTTQTLCSLLQIARPYRVDGLLEAVVQRLHQLMDGRNAAAVFNASAMAAGGGRGTGFDRIGGHYIAGDSASHEDTENTSVAMGNGTSLFASGQPNAAASAGGSSSLANGRRTSRQPLRIDTSFSSNQPGHPQRRPSQSQPQQQPPQRRPSQSQQAPPVRPPSPDTDTDTDDSSATSASEGNTSASSADPAEYLDYGEEVWSAERSCVVGLQMRGLRGLMEGRRMRERGRSVGLGPNVGEAM